MGNCACVNSQAEGNAQSEVAIPIQTKERVQASADILNPQELGQVVDSGALTEFSSVQKPEFPTPHTQSFNESEVLFLQSCIRSYLTKKATATHSGEMLQWSDGEESCNQPSDPTDLDPLTNLSKHANSVLGKRDPFEFDKDVQGVVSSPARILPDGSVYIGQWSVRNGKLHTRKGKGRLYSSSGSVSIGYWKDGKMHYRGRVIAPNGDFYEGGFENGLKEGVGEYQAYDGRMTYTGEWHEDKRHGTGAEVYSDGARYEGQFQNDEKTGLGQITYEDGSVYKGDFVAGEFDGFGEYSWADGRKYVGTWHKSKMNGKGKFTYLDGKWYDGEYVNDKKEGYGIYCWDNKTYEGAWKAGKMHGIGWLTNEKGKRKYQFNEGARGNEIKA